MDRNREIALKIAKEVSKAGGRTFYVGGLVRDYVLGIENKDVDIEVHGITPETLSDILDKVGKRTVMGASFGIYGLKGYDIDIAMPRKEHVTGRGHKDFDVFVDPFIGTEKGALRRDFTMNALMQDVLTGEIVDHFGGIQDAKTGILRHVNPETFAEDPLRVLRGAQFAARFHFQIADETKLLSQSMNLDSLSHERIMGETEKALLKSSTPSIYFEELKKMNQLEFWFTELFHAQNTETWNACMHLLDAAATVRKQAEKPLSFMLCALLTPLSKEDTSAFVQRLTGEVDLIRYVDNMHSLINQLVKLTNEEAGTSEFAFVYDASVVPEDLILLCMALNRVNEKPDKEELMNERLLAYKEIMKQPCVMGVDLVKTGMKPGPKMGEAVKYAHELHLKGIPKEEALQLTLYHFAP